MNDSAISGGDRAVVLGASMAGLLAARVLAESFREVVVVERDELPTGPAHRRGVPQGRHIHGLMGRGQQILEELFPGFGADLSACGAPVLDQSGDARLFLGGQRLRQAPGGGTVISASRPLLESYVRERVRRMPGIVIADRHDALGLRTADSRVTGVEVIGRADSSAAEIIDAGLVVDATGRGSRTPRWLAALGYPAPAIQRITADIAYTTVVLRLRKGALGQDRAILAPPAPGQTRGAGVAEIENGCHIVTLMGLLGSRPPVDMDAFVDYARSLPVPDIYEAIHDAEPVGEPARIRFPSSERHRYERLSRFPDRLVVMGDALCSFNPIYGQGMSVAAMEADALRAALTGGHIPRARQVMRRIATRVDIPWQLAAGGDLAFDGVAGKRTPAVRLANNYIRRLHAAAAYDSRLTVAFMRVAALLDPPTALFRPATAARVLGGRRGSAGFLHVTPVPRDKRTVGRPT
ncbi:FAD-dependent oxidoreductase [Nocardia sp. NPDC058499]|uniref:FAD-dependent oxidoreductase n=1 Tax=Nocardia sp. NPDC058499 TaxID=3346530 RepID=UPI00364F6463